MTTSLLELLITVQNTKRKKGGHTDSLTPSLLELLIAAKNHNIVAVGGSNMR